MESEGSQTIMPGEERATHSTGARSSRAKIKYDGTEASGPDSVVIDSRVGAASARAVMAEHHTALGMMLGAGVDGSIGSLRASGRGAISIRHRSLTSASAATSDEEELVESSSTTAVAASSSALLPRVEMGAVRASSGGVAVSASGSGHTFNIFPIASGGGGEGEVASASIIDPSLPLISRLKTHYQAFSVSTLFVKEPTELETFYQQIELVRDREYRKATHRERDRLEHAALGAAECDVGVTTAALRGLDERTHPDAMGSGRAKLEEARLFTGGDRPIQKLLVLGEAGVGKTTWSQHIAAEWAKGAAWLSQFDVVLCIPCFEIRDWLIGKSARLEEEEIWQHLLNLGRHDLAEITTVIRAEREGEAKILYVLDGWDELGSTEDAPLLKSTAAYLLAKPHVIVTTRPQALPDLKVRDREVFRADREIRLLGFNSEAQAQFAHTYFDILVNEDATTVYSRLSEGGGEAEPREKSVDEYASEFQGLLNTQQSLKHLTSNPVLLEILCYAHFDPKGTSLAADSTFRLTPLYQNVIERLSRRLLERIDIKAAEHWLIEDTPFREHPYAALCLKALKAICFETWQQNQPIIASKAVLAETSKPEHQREAEALSLGTRKDLPDHYALLTRDLGLMEVIKADRRTRVATAWRIKHYSIHEYLAAEVMLEQLLAARSDDRQAIIDQWVEQYKANQSSRVWIFITGMLAQQAIAHRDVEAMLQYWAKGFLNHYLVQARNTGLIYNIDNINHPIGLFHQSYFPLLKEIPIALFPSWELYTLLPEGIIPELLLVTAAGSESLDWLRYAQARGCELEFVSPIGLKVSAFHVAAVYGDLQAIRQLVDWSGHLVIERIMEKLSYEGNALVLALRRGHDAIARYCLAVLKDRGMSDLDYQEVLVDLLEKTMASASIEILDNLFGQLEEGLQRQIMNDSMQAKKACLIAAEDNHRDHLQWMFDHGMSIDQALRLAGRKATAVTVALGHGDVELVDWFIRHGTDFDPKGEAEIITWISAAEHNHQASLQWMLAHGMAIDHVGLDGSGQEVTALTAALSQGHLELANWLVESGAGGFDPKSEAAIVAWISAAEGNHHDSLQWMLDQGMAIDQVGNFHGHESTALTVALSQGHLELFDWLVERGAGFDPKSEAAVSVWISAAQNNHRDHLQWMLDHGIAIDQVGRNWHGREDTALIVALKCGHIELADWLMERGASFDLKSRVAISAWISAAEGNDRDRLRWLLDHGMEIDQVFINRYGEEATALTVGLGEGHIELADWLMSQGATLDLESEIIQVSFSDRAKFGQKQGVKWYLEHDMRPTETAFTAVCKFYRKADSLRIKYEIQQLMIDHGFPKPPGWDESRGRGADSSASALVMAPASVAGVRPSLTAADAAAPEDEVEERDSSTAPS